VLAPVARQTSSASATVVTLSGRKAPAAVSQKTVQGQPSGPFEVWSVPGQPRMMTTAPGAVFFTEDGDYVIARLAR
jgi:streptogramin lyase